MEEEIAFVKNWVKAEIEDVAVKNPQIYPLYIKDFSKENKRDISSKTQISSEMGTETYCKCRQVI